MPGGAITRVVFPALVCCAVLCVVPLGTVDAQSGNQSSFAGSNQTGSLDCNKGPAQVMGSYNVLRISGACSGLQVAGSGNKITVELGPGGTLNVSGSNNAITWSSTDGKPPTLTSAGSGNAVMPPLE
jgi:Protein of unknown function (DUF3060)